MDESVKVISNGKTICEDAISESVKKGAYNTMNWHKYSQLIADELKKQNDVVFFINQFAKMSFEWREWLGSTEERIYIYVKIVVRQAYSHDVFDLPSTLVAPFMR